MASQSLTLTYSCGHSRSWTWSRSGAGRPYRNNAHRDQMIAEARIGYCWACARTRKNSMAAREATLDRLPPLRGTPRQIAWANTIRSERLPELTEAAASDAWIDVVHQRYGGAVYVRNNPNRLITNPEYRAFRWLLAHRPACTLSLAARIRAADEAAFWIDQRDDEHHQILMRLVIASHGDDDDHGDAPAPVVPPLVPEVV